MTYWTGDALAQALQGKAAGKGKWVALCPAHEDSKPSLSITNGRTGRAIFVCRAGCMQEQVIEALQARGLWAQPRGRSAARSPSAYAQGAASPEPRRLDPLRILDHLDQLLMATEIIDANAPYMVVGEILEGAAAITYHVTSRVAHELAQRSPIAQRHVSRWMSERYPTAVFENQL